MSSKIRNERFRARLYDLLWSSLWSYCGCDYCAWFVYAGEGRLFEWMEQFYGQEATYMMSKWCISERGDGEDAFWHRLAAGWQLIDCITALLRIYYDVKFEGALIILRVCGKVILLLPWNLSLFLVLIETENDSRRFGNIVAKLILLNIVIIERIYEIPWQLEKVSARRHGCYHWEGWRRKDSKLYGWNMFHLLFYLCHLGQDFPHIYFHLRLVPF